MPQGTVAPQLRLTACVVFARQPAFFLAVVLYQSLERTDLAKPHAEALVRARPDDERFTALLKACLDPTSRV
jgi:hypothetical protein